MYCQSFRDFAVCIILNNSTETSLDLIQAHPLFQLGSIELFISGPQISNLSLALNYGISILSGRSDYIVRMDADDLMHPYRLERTYEYLQNCNNPPLIHYGNSKSLFG